VPFRGAPAAPRVAPAGCGSPSRAGRRRERRVKAALTGGTGFVGGHLAEALVARGASVCALVRSPARGERLRALGCRFVAGDLDDESVLAKLVKGCDVVFHVAGLVAARSAAEFGRANRDGARRVAEAAAREGVGRLVLVSSLAVTGPSPAGGVVDESSGSGPLTAYGRSKQAGEEAVRTTGVPVTIVRPPAVYGPRDRAFLTLFRTARRGLVPLLGSGEQELTLVHARDLAEALVVASSAPATLGRVYHAGHETPVSQRRMAEAVGEAVGRRVRLVRLPGALVRGALGAAGAAARGLGVAPLLDGDKACELLATGWVCSSAALRRDAGWEAVTSLEEGLAGTARAYRDAGWL
jgi:dihydroflavonol-4-reductase